MMEFTSTARKDGRWWVVQCDQYPAALSQVTRLDQAAEHQREAIAFVAGVPEDEVQVKVSPAIDPGLALLLQHSQEKRVHAEELAREASAGFHKAALLLQHDGFSMRDIGAILGVSHQRAHQLLSDESALEDR